MSDPDPKWLVDDILPTREVHVVAGPPGAGKTTWIFQFLLRWSQGRSIFGHPTHPLPFVYIALDRSAPSLLRTFERMGIDPKDIPFSSQLGAQVSPLELVKRVLAEAPKTKVIVVDGLGLLVAKKAKRENNYGDVASILVDFTLACLAHDITVLGVAHSPKAKEGERYPNPRDRVLGSTAWAGFVETLIIIEPKSPDKPDEQLVNLFLLPRNAPAETFTMERDGTGSLRPVQEAAEQTTEFFMARWLLDLREDVFTTDEAVAYGESKKVQRRQVERWLSKALKDGFVTRVRQGAYRRNRPS